jgi:hypothetical protein
MALAIGRVEAHNQGMSKQDMPKSELTRDEVAAALAVRQELGREYEPEVIDGFADRIERVIDSRVATRVAEQGARHSGAVRVAIWSVVAGFPITGVAGEEAGLAGIVVGWLGIAAVNFAYAWGNRRQRD